MPSLIDYKGLQVVDPQPTGDGGLAIQNDFKNLVDWNPKSVWDESADPSTSDDETADFYPGSLWLRTDTIPPKLFVCESAATGAAVWQEVALSARAVPYTGATANLHLGLFQLVASGMNAGFSIASPNLQAAIQNYWFPRTANNDSGWSLDFQDELALIDKK